MSIYGCNLSVSKMSFSEASLYLGESSMAQPPQQKKPTEQGCLSILGGALGNSDASGKLECLP